MYAGEQHLSFLKEKKFSLVLMDIRKDVAFIELI